MKNVMVLGHTGLLGRYVFHYLKNDSNINTICLNDFNVINISQDDIFDKLSYHNIDCVINCIGIIRQRRDITNKDTMIVNTKFPYLLANACSLLGANMIHISTDCVFDGKLGNYNEQSDTSAYDIYSKSKRMGEPPRVSTIRASFVGEELNRKLSLLEWVKQQSGKECEGYNDQMWNGITALTFAKIIHNIIHNELFWTGVRHVFSPAACSKFELVSMINEVYQLNISVKEVSSNKYANRVLTTIHPDFVSSFSIPSIREQLMELKEFDINSHGV